MIRILFTFLCVGLLSGSMVAQEKAEPAGAFEPGMESAEELEKKNAGTNLERKHYFQISHLHKERNLNSIRILNIMVSNFGEQLQGSKSDLEKVKKDYQIALRYYYRKAFIPAGKTMLESDKEISDLFQKFSKFYEKKADAILTECADAIATAEQNDIVVSGRESVSRAKDILEAQFKLRIAYSQMARAEEMNREDRFYDAIIHYRLAKDYGIKILSDLKLTPEERKKIADTYAIDLADNKGQTLKQNP